MTRLADVDAALVPHGLCVVAGFHPSPRDATPRGTGTLLLIGPDRDRLWPVFAAAPERTDGIPDPLDRWSRRVLEEVAEAFRAVALFPFTGPPYQPFVAWAARAEGSIASPVRLPISPSRGLWASYRGALALPVRIDVPLVPPRDPCLGCPAPCLSACPVVALTGAGYDVDTCVRHVASPAGRDCRDGCLVRRACPIGEEPPLAQRRFHMDAFIEARQPCD